MNLHHFSVELPLAIGSALARFEREFTYPLGAHARFRISHGEDYLPFFRAMGEPDLTLMESQGEILGCLARVRRRLSLDGKAAIDAHYLCDLKLRSASRGTITLPRLILETKRVIESSASQRCYCIVMGGTGKLPTDYTGRLGVPRFEKLGDIVILRLESHAAENPSCRIVTSEAFDAVSLDLPRTGYSALTVDRSSRSVIEPMHVVAGNGNACGIIEDTRKGKRLFMEDDSEMISGHLSRISFASTGAAVSLLSDAVSVAREAGLPALFAAIPASKADAILPELRSLHVSVAPASIYGHALEAGHEWWIDTAEI
jgi:hypothetical protein